MRQLALPLDDGGDGEEDVEEVDVVAMVLIKAQFVNMKSVPDELGDVA